MIMGSYDSVLPMLLRDCVKIAGEQGFNRLKESFTSAVFSFLDQILVTYCNDYGK